MERWKQEAWQLVQQPVEPCKVLVEHSKVLLHLKQAAVAEAAVLEGQLERQLQ